MTGPAVIVGGGLAALEIALALRGRAATPVTVIANETMVTYRPWLIRLPAGGPPPPLIPFARLLARAGVEVVPERAAMLDLEARRVILGSGRQIEYGQLVVATGAVADHGRIPGAQEHALFPCDLKDATELVARISTGRPHLAVIFGWERPGPGLEYAAWIAAHRSEVRLSLIHI